MPLLLVQAGRWFRAFCLNSNQFGGRRSKRPGWHLLTSQLFSLAVCASESGAAVVLLFVPPHPTTTTYRTGPSSHGINYRRRLRLTRLHQRNLQASSMSEMHAAWLAPRLLLRSSVFQEKLQSAQNNSHNCKANVRHWYYIDTKNTT